MNNDMISRSALLVVPNVCKVTEYDEAGFSMSYLAVPVEAVENAHAIDAVEVVRCKDCLNCGINAAVKYDGYRDDVRLCILHGIPVLPDDYCSGGVRMDGDSDG